MTQEERDYIIAQIKETIRVATDEQEGTQVVDLSAINACNPDYAEIERPLLTPDEIMKRLHLNSNLNDAGDISSAEDYPLIDNTSTGNKDGGAGGNRGNNIAGDKGQRPGDTVYNNDKLDYPSISDWNKIKIPDGTDMSDIAQQIINDDSFGNTKAVIEFATPSLQDEVGVDYKLYVKPGQQLTEDTLIAQATINGVTKDIKSIFSTGTVLANADGTDFKHLYSGCGCDRHIIIDNYEICGERTDINTDKLQELTDEFASEAYIHQLIVDNMPDSVLPFILQKRYDKYKYRWIGFIKVRVERPNGREIFSGYEDRVNEIRNKYSEDIQNMGSADSIKKTNGNVRKINKLGNDIIERREKYMQDMIYMYSEYSRNLSKCEYDEDNYYDCKYLAWSHSLEYHDADINMQIGNSGYDNYYLMLLSRIDMYAGGENKYVQEYYNIIKEIIEIRIARERYSLYEIEQEFDNLFHRAINRKHHYPMKDLRQAMKAKNTDIKYSDIYSWIAGHSWKGTTKKSERYVEYAQRQLANIFLFVWNYHKYDLPKPIRYTNGETRDPEGIETMLDLVKQEWKKISEFWDKILEIKSRLTVNKCVQQFTEFARSGVKYHDWPSCGYLTVGEDTYNHYLFQNTVERDQTLEDEDFGSEYIDEVPEVPDEYLEPPEDPGIDFLKQNENDPQDDEISIIDFKYWQRYFAVATMLSLPFLNCGLDIPPFVMMIPLPLISIAVASVYIKQLDLVIVFGLTIRGMYIFPCVFYVNCSSKPLSIMTPLIATLKMIQDKINAKMEALTVLPIISIANGFISVVESDSRRLRNENIQLDAAIAAIEAKKVKNMEAIKKQFESLANPGKTLRQQVCDPIANLYNKNKPPKEDENKDG